MEIAEFLKDLNAHLEVSYWFRMIKFFLGFYLVIMVIAIVLALYRLYKFGYWTVLVHGQDFPQFPLKGLDRQWPQVLSRMESENSSQWKAAIIEASEMLDTILKTIKYPGDTLGGKLDSMLPSQLSNLEQVKEAVKIRNKIVQDADFQLSHEEAKKVLDEFAESLRYYEAIS